jgi:spermidine synthase
MSKRTRSREPNQAEPASGSRATSILILATAVVTGAAVMMLELLGTRVIGPFYGVSMFVWSSLISVTLISLAVGYFLGGRLADRGRVELSMVLIVAGLATAAVPALRGPVLGLTNPLGLRVGAFLSALLLFFVPLTVLAMVGPYVVKTLATRQEKVGSVSGAVMALSTAGSVAGTLLLGFFLLPVVGTRAILYSIAAVLMFGGICLRIWLRVPSDRKPAPLASLVLLCLAGAAMAAAERGHTEAIEDYKLVYEAESIYGKIRVLDDERRNIRWMLSDASTISAVRIGSSQALFPYLSLLEGLPHFNLQGRTALVVGLGAGYLPMALEAHGVAADAIEIDPVVARAAAAFFPFKQPRRLIVGDARYEVARMSQRYDFVIHDCFTGGSIPPHVLSVEMLRDVRAHLNEGGVLALNFFGFNRGADASALEAVAATLRSVFPHQRIVTTAPDANPIDNIILASDQPLVAKPHDGPCSLSDGARSYLERMDSLQIALAADSGFVITDDFNPLETLQIPKAEAYREMLAKRLGLGVLLQ